MVYTVCCVCVCVCVCVLCRPGHDGTMMEGAGETTLSVNSGEVYSHEKDSVMEAAFAGPNPYSTHAHTHAHTHARTHTQTSKIFL